MSHIRKAIEELRHYYIQKLFDAGVFHQKDESPYHLTLTELETLFKRSNRP
ncbi:Fur-regulated basic protein FbpA [Bacillus massilinigeriensis]|uniref:Fur-regulated basic protein FbpA n=1 Tax=Bacillus massilionigeriensis TaxID=1805475 RepID=UPI00096B2352|nr:Fur-regulated basic protein FbpA [Bacillus massilionigeriensis]